MPLRALDLSATISGDNELYWVASPGMEVKISRVTEGHTQPGYFQRGNSHVVSQDYTFGMTRALK